MINSKQLMEAYGQWMEDLENDGFVAFLLTFKFKHMSGSPLLIQKTMERAVEEVYATSVTRIFRYPNSASSKPRLPRWLVCPDYPVLKYGKTTLRDVTINGGRHMHGIAMVPAESRLPVRFDLHLAQEEALYVRAPLNAIHAEPVRNNLGYVTEYCLKSIGWMRVEQDELVVLPRTRSEMTGRRHRLHAAVQVG